LEGRKEIFDFFLQLDRGDVARDLSPAVRTEARQRLKRVLERIATLLPNKRMALVLWALCVGVAHLAKGGPIPDLPIKPRHILDEGVTLVLRHGQAARR
jgi:hypothetical protein